MTYAADFTKGNKTRSASLMLYAIENGQREMHKEFDVAGKAHARKIAKERGYQCWNF